VTEGPAGRNARGTTAALLRVWAPAALSNSVLTVEIPAVAALVARGRGATAALAAFGVALILIQLTNSPVMPLASTTAVLGSNRAAFRHLERWAVAMGGALSLALAGLLLSPLAHWLLGTVLRLPEEVAAQAGDALFFLTPAPLVVSWRRCNQGALIALRRTAGMAYASGARIVVSMSVAWTAIVLAALPGARAGALALMAGAAVEALVVTVWAHRFLSALPPAGAPLRTADVARFHAPLAGPYVVAMLPQSLVTAGIARGLGAEVSLAAWPVLYGFTSIFAGAAVEVESITASFARAGESLAAIRRFAWGLGAALSAVVVLGAVPPLGHLYFAVVSGLDAPAASLAVRAVPVMAVVPLLVTLRAWLRGRLLAEARTVRIQAAMLAALVVLVVFLAAGDLAWRPTGIYVGALAFAAYLAAEVAGLRVLQARPAGVRRRDVQLVTRP